MSKHTYRPQADPTLECWPQAGVAVSAGRSLAHRPAGDATVGKETAQACISASFAHRKGGCMSGASAIPNR